MSKNSKSKKSATKKPRIRVTNDEADASESKVASTPAKKKWERKDGKMSGLDAAAKVLAEAGQPLNAREMLERIQAANLWETNGKTPHATLYAAIIREIDLKGKESRFTKTERGRFTVA